MVLSVIWGSINYMLSLFKSTSFIWNMYLHGVVIVTAFKVILTSISIYSNILSGHYEQIPGFIIIGIDTLFPMFLSIKEGIVGVEAMIKGFMLNVGVGVVSSTFSFGRSIL